mgnify:CR=1 FL=1
MCQSSIFFFKFSLTLINSLFLGDSSWTASSKPDQNFLEEIVIEILSLYKSIYNFDKIYFAGGVFANVILSYKIYEALNLKCVNVVPYMGDEGAGVGSSVLSIISTTITILVLSQQISGA